MANHIERRKFLATLGGAAAAWPVGARTQQPKVPTIGALVIGRVRAPPGHCPHRRGPQARQAHGVLFGRPRKLTPHQRREAIAAARGRFARGPGADKGALRWCTSDATVAFTGPGPSSPLAGIGGMSASPAGSSKRGDYP
jgi:hypothetical protein